MTDVLKTFLVELVKNGVIHQDLIDEETLNRLLNDTSKYFELLSVQENGFIED